MEDPKWLRLVTVGLVLAALAVGYFLLTGRFSSNNQPKPNNQVINQVNPTPIPVVSETTMPTPTSVGLGSSPSVSPSVSPSASPSAAAPYPRTNVTTLPRTGYQLVILGIIAAGVMISGWGLRKYPH